MVKCRICGSEQSKYPIFKEVEGKKIFIWQNLFKMDLVNFFLVIGIVLIIFGAKVLLDETTEIQKHPCVFCEKNGCCSQPSNCYESNTEMIKPDIYIEPIKLS